MKDKIIVSVLLIFFSILIIYDGYVAVVTARFATRSGIIRGLSASFEGKLQMVFGVLCIVILITVIIKDLSKKLSDTDSDRK